MRVDMEEDFSLISICKIDEYGCINPVFDLKHFGAPELYNLTGGELKYFSCLRGKKVKLTLEIVEELYGV